MDIILFFACLGMSYMIFDIGYNCIWKKLCCK